MQKMRNDAVLQIPETMLRTKRTRVVRTWLDSNEKMTVRDVDYAVAVLERDEEGSRGDAAGLVALGALAIALATFSATNPLAVIGFYIVLMLALIGLLLGQLDGLGRESVLRRLFGLRRDLLDADAASATRDAPIQIAKAWGVFRRP